MGGGDGERGFYSEGREAGGGSASALGNFK